MVHENITPESGLNPTADAREIERYGRTQVNCWNVSDEMSNRGRSSVGLIKAWIYYERLDY